MKKCKWAESKEKDYYMTSCGGQYEFSNLGTPEENLFSFCPFCGAKIEVYTFLFQKFIETNRNIRNQNKKIKLPVMKKLRNRDKT